MKNIYLIMGLILMLSKAFAQQKDAMIVVVSDISKSVKIPTMQIRNYYEIARLAQRKNYHTVLSVGVIGNTRYKEFTSVELRPENPMPRGLTLLSEQTRMLQDNRRIRNSNKIFTENWLKNIGNNSTKIKGTDFSDVGEMIRKAELLLNEPAYEGYQKFLILISDLENDPEGKGFVPWKHGLIRIKNLRILSIGSYKQPNFQMMPNYTELQNIEGISPNLNFYLK